MSLDAGKDRSVPDVSNATFANLRRAKSLDRRVTESSMTVSACSVIAIHVGYFWYVHDVMHHSFMLSDTQYYISVCWPSKLHATHTLEFSYGLVSECCWGDPLSLWLVSWSVCSCQQTPPAQGRRHTVVHTPVPLPMIINS